MTARDLPRQLPLQLRLDDEATFTSFLANARNHALIRHLQDSLAGCGNRSAGEQDVSLCSGTVLRHFTWLSGEEGAGRTHLLQALCHQGDELGLSALYIPLSDYQQFTPEILDGLESLSLLCLDDLDAIAGLPAWESALFTLYNRLAESDTRLFVAARSSPAHLQVKLPDLASRLQSAAVFQVQPLSDEGKVQALQLRARGRGFELGSGVASYLMARGERDMKSLFEVLQKLDQHSLETKRRVTVPLLKSLMGW